MTTRNLVLVLGDQLNRESAAFDGFDASRDTVWMSETPRETTHVWCHKLRIAYFLAAMRHFRDALRADGITVRYAELATDPRDDRGATFTERLHLELAQDPPERLIVAEPGDWRVREELVAAAARCGLVLEIRPDRTFLCSTAEFAEYASNHRGLPLEAFYRWQRKRLQILVEADDTPVGGRWNFDADNRRGFGRQGPPLHAPIAPFLPDETTRAVLALVAKRFAAHPGSLEHFTLPVERAQALALLDDFVANRLGDFGTHQDAMWLGEPFLFHSRLSVALNVKLLSAREVVDAVQASARSRALPINSIEGFVRQVVGWREFVRGAYWLLMPAYARRNTFGADGRLPPAFWTGETDMRCVRECTTQLLRHAYAHHIQRLMVFGNFALLSGVDPLAFHDWHMAMYADAVDWVSLPNAFGMSQHADGGVVGTKPYIASGAYIERMSDYCRGCRYQPTVASGPDACPFTTLYWDFLARQRTALASNPRMRYPLQSLDRKDASELARIGAKPRPCAPETRRPKPADL